MSSKPRTTAKTWTNIGSVIPEGQSVYVIREDVKAKNLLFLGTEFGAFVSLNGGQTWTDFNLNMPTVAFHDLLIQPRDNDLIAATHGRGIWIMDDITGLRQAAQKLPTEDAALFETSKAGHTLAADPARRRDMGAAISSIRARTRPPAH